MFANVKASIAQKSAKILWKYSSAPNDRETFSKKIMLCAIK